MQNEGVNNNLKTDFEKLQELYVECKKDEKTLLELEESIKNSQLLTITNPIRGASNKVRKYYIIQQKRIAEDFNKCNSEFNSLSAQEAKLQGEIETIQYILKNTIEQKKNKQEKFKEAESDLNFKENVLRMAKNMFDVKFNMDIEIEDKTRETFIAVVYFDRAIKKPVKFKVNHVQRKIIDFDASSVLSSTEEEELKSRFKSCDNIQALTCALRDKISKN